MRILACILKPVKVYGTFIANCMCIQGIGHSHNQWAKHVIQINTCTGTCNMNIDISTMNIE